MASKDRSAADQWRWNPPTGWADEAKRQAEASQVRCEAALAASRAKYEGRRYIVLCRYGGLEARLYVG